MFEGFNQFKRLFGPMRIDLDWVLAQTVDSGPESWHLGKFGYWGGGPLAESSRCRQESRQKSRGAIKKIVLGRMFILCSPNAKTQPFLTVSKDYPSSD